MATKMSLWTGQQRSGRTAAAHQKQQICCKMCVPALAGVMERQPANPVCSGDASRAPMMRSCVLDKGPVDKAASQGPRM
ncbi:hypothetical protein CSOJ01_01518 [Colletotrichum sojae]|uniref:Uncharacterized protein n=1 Tax=Colletotrichum sojae TaxID=2175907 RepID=A0A8H6JUA8_9PEZI|nr:hypothetical protein CSOJ01_01518 [Colletotrichum sojae]